MSANHVVDVSAVEARNERQRGAERDPDDAGQEADAQRQRCALDHHGVEVAPCLSLPKGSSRDGGCRGLRREGAELDRVDGEVSDDDEEQQGEEEEEADRPTMDFGAGSGAHRAPTRRAYLRSDLAPERSELERRCSS